MTTSIEVHNQVIYRRFHGKVSIDDMVQSWKEIFNNYEDLEAYKGVVTSFLEAEIVHEDSNMNVIMEYLSGYLERIRGLKVAIVMDTPLVTNTIIMNQKMKNMHIRPFTTEEAAVMWIES